MVLELPGEVALIAEAGFMGNPGYGVSGINQGIAGGFDTDLDNEFHGRNLKGFFEFPFKLAYG